MMGVFAEFERSIIRERVRAGLTASASDGRACQQISAALRGRPVLLVTRTQRASKLALNLALAQLQMNQRRSSEPSKQTELFRHLAIVTPVFNDWTSFSRLVADIDALNGIGDIEFTILAVDDGSNKSPLIACPRDRPRRVRSIEIIALASNMGHQRAIAVGLVEAFERENFDGVLVMDADGEDRPTDIPLLLKEARQILAK